MDQPQAPILSYGTTPDRIKRSWRIFLSRNWDFILLQAAHRMLAAAWLILLGAVILHSQTPRAIPEAQETLTAAAQSTAISPSRLALWTFLLSDLSIVTALASWWIATQRNHPRREAVGAMLFGAFLAIATIAALMWIRG